MEPTVVCLKNKKTSSGFEPVVTADVYIGRRFSMGGHNYQASKWANPFKAEGDVNRCIRAYEAYVRAKPELMAAIPELYGKTLGCFCKKKGHEPCHGDVLVKLAREALARKRPDDCIVVRMFEGKPIVKEVNGRGSVVIVENSDGTWYYW